MNLTPDTCIRMHITIWDTNTSRIAQLEKNILTALRRLNMTGYIDSMSEPPLLMRMNLMHKVPALEINGDFWTLRHDELISVEECYNLFVLLRENQ